MLHSNVIHYLKRRRLEGHVLAARGLLHKAILYMLRKEAIAKCLCSPAIVTQTPVSSDTLLPNGAGAAPHQEVCTVATVDMFHCSLNLIFNCFKYQTTTDHHSPNSCTCTREGCRTYLHQIYPKWARDKLQDHLDHPRKDLNAPLVHYQWLLLVCMMLPQGRGYGTTGKYS